MGFLLIKDLKAQVPSEYFFLRHGMHGIGTVRLHLFQWSIFSACLWVVGHVHEIYTEGCPGICNEISDLGFIQRCFIRMLSVSMYESPEQGIQFTFHTFLLKPITQRSLGILEFDHESFTKGIFFFWQITSLKLLHSASSTGSGFILSLWNIFPSYKTILIRYKFGLSYINRTIPSDGLMCCQEQWSCHLITIASALFGDLVQKFE